MANRQKKIACIGLILV